MTNQALQVLEGQLNDYAPQFLQVLPKGMEPDRIIRTVLIACEQNPKLLQANRTSVMRSALSAATLGLEVDGVTGQGYLVPFKGRCQFIPGYKGYVTLAARGGRTLEGFVVREGDGFDFDEANGLIKHSRQLGNEDKRRVIAAYAVARSKSFPTMIKVLSLDQLLAVRNESAGYKAKGAASTWGTNFEAMCRKTPMRLMSNDLPVLGMQLANAMETQVDLGRAAYVNPDQTVSVVVSPADDPKTDYTALPELCVRLPEEVREMPDVGRWVSFMTRCLDKVKGDDARTFVKDNMEIATKLAETHPEAKAVVDRMQTIQAFEDDNEQ